MRLGITRGLTIDARMTNQPSIVLVCAVVFTVFLAIGLPLALLPEQVHGTLGFASFLVGLVIGAQSWATLVTRRFAGTRSDTRGPRSAVVFGLGLASLAGLLTALSSLIPSPSASLATLLVGRGVLGLGESLVVTGALAWGVALAGREHSGRVMAWVGIAMYGAIAAGAPLGALLRGQVGFLGTMLVAAAAPLLGLALTRHVNDVAPAAGQRLPFSSVSRAIWLPGMGLALATLSFGSLAAYSVLAFTERGWSHAPWAMTAFGAAYVLARLVFSRLPDRFGGARVAAASASLAAVGQLALWAAPTEGWALTAAALTGLGFSLAFPAFGLEALRRVPPQNRGTALGAYAACFDLSMGVGVPALGLLVTSQGPLAAFAGAAGAAALSAAIALRLVRVEGAVS